MKTLSVKLPEQLADWLASEAKRTHRSRSEIVRLALEQERNGSGNSARGPRKSKSMADVLADLKGTFHGPGDLSTNPQYFDDFGK